ncbi:alpha/beta hydrolase [Nanoarchaeota archaeon]
MFCYAKLFKGAGIIGNMKKKDLIIIVPGSNFRGSKKKTIKRIIVYLYSLVHIFRLIYYNYAKLWTKKLDKKGRKLIWLHWSRGITQLSIFFAVKKLNNLIKQYKNRYNIKLVGISLGGEIIQEAANKFDDDSIKKIILVCSTNEHKKTNLKTKIVNIYSSYDIFAKLSSIILNPIHGGTVLSGENVKNIDLPKFTHHEFCEDAKIKKGKYKGKTITNLIDYFLDN